MDETSPKVKLYKHRFLLPLFISALAYRLYTSMATSAQNPSDLSTVFEAFRSAMECHTRTMEQQTHFIKTKITEMESNNEALSNQRIIMMDKVEGYIKNAQPNLQVVAGDFFEGYEDAAAALEFALQTGMDRFKYADSVFTFTHPRQSQGKVYCLAYSYICRRKGLCAICLKDMSSFAVCFFFCCKAKICLDCGTTAVNNYIDAIKSGENDKVACYACYAKGQNGPQEKPTDLDEPYVNCMLAEELQDISSSI